MKLFVATLFSLVVLMLSVTTWREGDVQMELAKLEGEARAILGHPDHLGAFEALAVETKGLDVFLKGTADREVRDRAIKLLHYGEGKIQGLRAGVIVDQVAIGNPEPPELHVEAQDLLLSFSGRIPEGDFRNQLEAVAKEFPVTPSLSLLRTNRDVGGAEWFGDMAPFVRKFLTGAEAAKLTLGADRLVLDRMVADDAARDELIKAAHAMVPAGVTVDDSRLRVAPGLQLRREADGWMVSGVVPDEATVIFIRQIVESADVASAGKNDYTGISVRPGMPAPVWLRRFSGFFEAFVAGVRYGAELTVTGNEVLMQGDVTDLAIAARLETAAQNTFGAPMVVVSRLINASNTLRKLSVDFGASPSADIVVTGGVPNAEAFGAIERGLKEAFPSRRLDLRALKTDPAAQTEEWVDKLARFWSEFARRTQGTGFVKLNVREGNLGGAVANEITRDALGLYLGWALGPSFVVNNMVSVDAKAKVAAPYEMAQVFFEEGSALITSKEQSKLSTVAARLGPEGDGVVLIKGFASKTGTLAANLAISARRAEAVRGQLVRLGIPEDRMQVQPTGKPGGGDRGGASDRRVEMIILE